MMTKTGENPTSGPSPYMAAQQEWNERYGSYIARAHTMTIIAVIALATAFLSVGGLLWVIGQGQVRPYVVELENGEVRSVAPANGIQTLSSTVVEKEIAEFVEDTRSVVSDASVGKKMINRAYAHLSRNTAAYQYLNQYFQKDGHNPLLRAKDETVSIHVEDVLPLSKKSYQVSWTETAFNRNGSLKGKTNMKGIMTVALKKPSDQAEIMKNPLGVYITDLSWTEVL